MTDKFFEFTQDLPVPADQAAPVLADINNWHNFTQIFSAPKGEARDLEPGFEIAMVFTVKQGKSSRPISFQGTIVSLPDAQDPVLLIQQKSAMGALSFSWRYEVEAADETSRLRVRLEVGGWASGLLWAGFRGPYRESMQIFAKDLVKHLARVEAG